MDLNSKERSQPQMPAVWTVLASCIGVSVCMYGAAPALASRLFSWLWYHTVVITAVLLPDDYFVNVFTNTTFGENGACSIPDVSRLAMFTKSSILQALVECILGSLSVWLLLQLLVSMKDFILNKMFQSVLFKVWLWH